ncbi:unnamed protein product [Paramecium sonneborni]|uniref:Uncharacterized protein n=1 Tax=Paramecium sonneborni TaxID=65129 RepID=A0A8S1RN64_9CILI|nr:unnamed protein product [Paramecium sonneborni]
MMKDILTSFIENYSMIEVGNSIQNLSEYTFIKIFNSNKKEIKQYLEIL